jgi:hypothetical protein
MVINQAVEATGLSGTQQLATLLDGISRHTPEGHNFKNASREKAGSRRLKNAMTELLIGPKMSPSTNEFSGFIPSC